MKVDTQLKFRNFCSHFMGVSEENLPQDIDKLEDALIADALRFEVWNSPRSEHGWRRIHINRLLYRAEKKLQGVIKDLDRERVKDVLRGGKTPSLVFLGDLLELRRGYYSMSPSRGIPFGNSTALFISGVPTSVVSFFTPEEIDIRVEGISRILEGDILEDQGLKIQNKEEYVGIDENKFNEEFLFELIDQEEKREWQPDNEWRCYQPENKYYLNWDESEKRVLTDKLGWISFWRVQSEDRKRRYYLKIEELGGEPKMIEVPARYYKQICLLIDSLDEKDKKIDIRQSDDGHKISCNFKVPRSQIRWLHATGAKFDGFNKERGTINWILRKNQVESTIEIFQRLPIEVKR